ncbi:MAG: MFS transporter [Desulfobacterales bacterium]
MPQSPATNVDPQRWMGFIVLCLIYFLVYFHRVSTSVLAPELLTAFQTNATVLGLMSSMYFYLYALEQPMVGYLADRLGPRRVVGWWTLVAATGCALFAMAPSVGWAAAGRALIGFGVGGVYVPALKALSQWFSRRRVPLVLGLLLAWGNLGAVVATTPLVWMSSRWGWRACFWVIGAATFSLGLITLLVLRDHPHTETPCTPAEGQDGAAPPASASPFGQALRVPRFWIVAALFFILYGSILAFQGLWATPFLAEALGVDHLLASQLNMLIPVGFMVGAPGCGWFCSRFGVDKTHVFIAMVAVLAVLWSGITFGVQLLGIFGMAGLLLVLGAVTGGFCNVLWALVYDTTPPTILGVTTGLLNPFPLLGVAVFQVLTGAVMDRVDRVGDVYSTAAYQQAFLVCLIATLFCLLLSLALKGRLAPDRRL